MEVSLEKINKLICRLQSLVMSLNDHIDLDLHKNIDQFYYMQKLEELEILKSQREEAYQRLQSINTRMFAHYHEIAGKWSRDARWMSLRLDKCKPKES